MIKINNVQISGSIDAISSKSMAHRHLICASLSNSDTKLYLPDISDDIQRTIDCLETLGVSIKIDKDYLFISPINVENLKKNNLKDGLIFDFGESGTTLRFMLPIVSSLLNKSEFIGRGRLPDRPIKELLDLIKNSGCKLSSDKLPFIVENRFEFNDIEIRGDISSQYISGLLLSAPLQKDNVKINIYKNLESKPYVDMTIQVMKEYKIDLIQKNNSYYINKNSKYISNHIHRVESDWSNAAFFLVAGAISQSYVELKGLNFNSLQGDMKIMEILKEFGAYVETDEENNTARISYGELKAVDVDLTDIPDLLPILSVLASKAKGKTRFYNASRLRLKESDRIKTTAEMIRNLGGTAIEKEDSLIIESKGYLDGGKVNSYNDHRIAMSATVSSIICKSPVILQNEKAVNKSYIDFYRDFEKLGGSICHL